MLDEDAVPVDDVPLQAPEQVTPVPLLQFDVEALEKLFEGPDPAVMNARASSVATIYLMGDASGTGFGSALWNGEGLAYQAGNHAPYYAAQSSNFCKADNLVSRMGEGADTGIWDENECFILTDNEAFEGIFYKGHSSSPELTDVILHLWILQQKHSKILHVIHVAGMKASGIDGLSPGDMLEGMMIGGANPQSYLPFHLNTNEQMNGAVIDWVHSWWRDIDCNPWADVPLKHLTPEDWFCLHKSMEPRLWIQPPAAMTAMMEMIFEDRLAHPFVPHVFAVPRLMTHLWRKVLSKDANLMFAVPCGFPF